MKSKVALRNFLALAACSLLAVSSASAQTTYYWDGNNDTTGFGTAGGTWADPTTGTLTSGWTTAINGDLNIVGNSITTTTLDSLNFGRVSAGNSLATGTITVSGTVNSGNMTFGASPSGPVTTLTGGTINFGNAVTIAMGNAFAIIESQISGAATSISKTGTTSTLRFSNTNNSYTGLTSIIGTLESTHLANGSSNSSIGASSNAAANLVIGTSGGSVGTLSYIGAGGSTDRLFTLSANTGTLASNGTGTIHFTNTGSLAYGTAGQNRTLGLSGTNTGLNIIDSLIGDNGAGVVSVTKSGTGTWKLGNTANSYTGASTVQQGTLVINSINDAGLASVIGAGALILGSGNNTGTLAYTGAAAESNRTVQVNSSVNTNSGGAAILNYGTGALTFDAATFNAAYTNGSNSTRVLTLGGTNGGTISGKIVNNSANSLVGIAKAGSGTWTLQGNNENTGTSSISGGGNLVLDYTSNTGSKLSDTISATSLTLSGGTLTLKGGSSLTEVVGGTRISNGASFITRDGGDTVLQMNDITRQNGGSISFLDGTVAKTTTVNNSFGMFGGWATIGDDFAANDGSGNIVAYSGSTTALPSTGAGGAGNYTLTGDQSQTGTSTLSASTLKITGTGVTDNTLALGGTNLRIQNNADFLAGGILYIGGGTGVFNITADATNGIEITNSNRDLIINTVRDTLQISARLNALQSTAGVLKAGAGTLVLSSTENVYTGIVYVNEGVLRLASDAAAGTSAGGIRVQYGAALELSNNITVGAEALDLDGSGISNGGALRNQSGSNTYGGLITTGVSGARINSNASTSLTLTGGIATNIFQDVTFGGAGNTTVSTTAISGAGGLIKDGAGTLTLSANNTYTGETLVSAGTLFVSGSLASDVMVSDTATLAGGGTVGDLILGGGSFFDLFLAVDSADSLDATTISFAAAGFGIDNLLANGAAVDWGTVNNGIYTLITGTLNSTNLGNFGSANAYDIGGGRTVYFQDGSLQLVVIPEPSAALLGALGLLGLALRRRR